MAEYVVRIKKHWYVRNYTAFVGVPEYDSFTEDIDKACRWQEKEIAKMVAREFFEGEVVEVEKKENQ